MQILAKHLSGRQLLFMLATLFGYCLFQSNMGDQWNVGPYTYCLLCYVRMSNTDNKAENHHLQE